MQEAPFDFRLPLVNAAHTGLGLLAVAAIFGWIGHSESAYGEGSEINLFGWLLLGFGVLAGLGWLGQLWSLVRPGRWQSYLFWWEAGRHVGRTYRVMPQAPPVALGAAAIVRHGALAFMTGGASVAYHVVRAAATAARMEKRQREYEKKLVAATATRELAHAAAVISLEALLARYERRLGRAWRCGRGTRRIQQRSAFAGHVLRELANRAPVAVKGPIPSLHLRRAGSLVALPVTAAFAAGLAAALPTFTQVRPPDATRTYVTGSDQVEEAAAKSAQPYEATPSDRPRPSASAVVSVVATMGPAPSPSWQSSPAAVVVAVPRTSPPSSKRLPTCADAEGVVASYVLVSSPANVDGMKAYWPRITVVNHSGYPAAIEIGGEGTATFDLSPETSPTVPWQTPYELAPVKPGRSVTFDSGDSGQYGTYALPVYDGDRITRITVTVRVTLLAAGQDSGPTCNVRVGRR